MHTMALEIMFSKTWRCVCPVWYSFLHHLHSASGSASQRSSSSRISSPWPFSSFYIQIHWAYLYVFKTPEISLTGSTIKSYESYLPTLPFHHQLQISLCIPRNSIKPWSVGWAHHLQTSTTHQFHTLVKRTSHRTSLVKTATPPLIPSL